MSPSPGAAKTSGTNLSKMFCVRVKSVLFILVLVAGQNGLAQVREEDQGGTMRNTMNDLNKLNSEGKPLFTMITLTVQERS